MKVKSIGASGGEVTGSCSIIEIKRTRMMIDCGMFHGEDGPTEAMALRNRERHGITLEVPVLGGVITP